MDDAGQALLTAFTSAVIAFLVILIGILLIVAIRLARNPSAVVSALLAAFDLRPSIPGAEGAAHPPALPRVFAAGHDRRRRIRDGTAIAVSAGAFMVVLVAVASSFRAPPPAGPATAGQVAVRSPAPTNPAAAPPASASSDVGAATASPSVEPAPIGAVAGVTAMPGAVDPGTLPPAGSAAPTGPPPAAPAPPAGGPTTPPGGVPAASTPPPAPPAAPTPTPPPAAAPTPTPGPPPTPAPPVIASWSAEPQTLLDPSAHFAGSCTGCTSWTIDFGDGAQTSGSGSTVDVSHHYAGLLDRYDATLTVHGPGGSRSRTITVSVQLL